MDGLAHSQGPDLFQLRKWALASQGFLDNTTKEFLVGTTDTTVAIEDKYPKAIFHVLIMPRPQKDITVEHLDSLKSLLGKGSKVGKEQAKAVLEDLGAHAKQIREEMQKEMQNRYKFQWDIWTGFHAVPSMHHIHLHVISSDLHSARMKTKKHYNSFHPKLGFFLHYDDVMSWFDAVPSVYKDKTLLRGSMYEPVLKQDLSCFKCTRSFRNMPTLKEHLEGHHMTKYNAVLDAEERDKKKKLAAASKPLSKAAPTPAKKRKQGDGKPSSKASGSSRASTSATTGTSLGTDIGSLGSMVKRRRTESPAKE
ncbi:HIT-like domain-containing protein [Cytidiella melzeri]|nr:HIT-like domain-containing protein [Cytidiella melzeri]